MIVFIATFLLVNYQALAYSGLNQSFAAVSTNAGHDSTEDLSWWTSNAVRYTSMTGSRGPEQID